MNWTDYLLPLLFASLTGFITSRVILKLLFHPARPVSFLGFKVQGILPKNQKAIAQNLGMLVSKELLSFSAMQEKVINPENFNKLKPEIEVHIDTFLRERLKDSFPMLAMFIGDKTVNQLKSAFLAELEDLFPILMKSYMAKLEQEFDMEKMVTEKVSGFSLEKAEALLNRYAKKQLLYLQLTGAGIGFLAGLIYVFMILLLNS